MCVIHESQIRLARLTRQNDTTLLSYMFTAVSVLNVPNEKVHLIARLFGLVRNTHC